MRFHDYSPRAFDENGVPFAGVSYHPPAIEIFGSEAPLRTKVLDSEHLRPDKVAKRLWGVPDASWILDTLNDFETGIIEYSKGTEIIYVPLARLRAMGLV